MIKLRNVSKIYNQGDKEIQALKNFSYEFPRNQIITIQGKSGSGKSTLLKIIGLVEYPTEGEVFLDEENTGVLNDEKRSKLRNQKTAFITQDFSLIENSTVEYNVLLPQYIGKRFKEKESIKKLDEVLEKLGILRYKKVKVKQLSGGERQRVSIARAIMSDCEVILADEPTGSLDSVIGMGIMDYLLEIKNLGKTIILVTHDDDFAKLGDVRLKMKDGMLSA